MQFEEFLSFVSGDTLVPVFESSCGRSEATTLIMTMLGPQVYDT